MRVVVVVVVVVEIIVAPRILSHSKLHRFSDYDNDNDDDYYDNDHDNDHDNDEERHRRRTRKSLARHRGPERLQPRRGRGDAQRGGLLVPVPRLVRPGLGEG